MHKARNSDLMQPVQLTFLAETPDVKSRDTFFFFFFGLQGRCPLYAGCEAHKDTRRTYVV